MSIEISSSNEVPHEVLADLVAELPNEFQARASKYRRVFCSGSVEPLSWFTLIAGLDWWIQLFGVYTTIFLASLVNKAGSETWEKRKEIRLYICKVASTILKAKKKCRENTTVALALRIPDTDYEAKLALSGKNDTEVAQEMMLFVHYAPEVIELLKNKEFSGPVGLRILDDNSMEVNGFDSETRDNVQRVLQKKIS